MQFMFSLQKMEGLLIFNDIKFSFAHSEIFHLSF